MFYDHDKAMEEIAEPRKGWAKFYDHFTTEDAPNSIPGGMPVKTMDDSLSGKVLGSYLPGGPGTTFIAYYVEWDTVPKHAYFYHGSEGHFKIAC